MNIAGWRTRLQQKNSFLSFFSHVESSLKNLSYVLMYFKYNTNEQLIILSKPSSIYRVVFFLTKPKPTTNRITILILFLRELENQIKRIIPILFQVGLGHGPLAGTWAIAQQIFGWIEHVTCAHVTHFYCSFRWACHVILTCDMILLPSSFDLACHII